MWNKQLLLVDTQAHDYGTREGFQSVFTSNIRYNFGCLHTAACLYNSVNKKHDRDETELLPNSSLQPPVISGAAIHCSTTRRPTEDASCHYPPVSLPNAAYAGRKKSDVMPALDSQAFWHTETHIHKQINVIYGIITPMTVRMLAHHSVLSNYWGVYNSPHTKQTVLSQT